MRLLQKNLPETGVSSHAVNNCVAYFGQLKTADGISEQQGGKIDVFPCT
jgi:hypothetical protein